MIQNKANRSAFTMIELVISIVVMGIALMSIPTILQQVSKSDEFSMTQEAILATMTKVSNILTYKWDENSSSAGLNKVISAGSTAELDINSTTFKRRGHFAYNGRRMSDDLNKTATNTSDAEWGNAALDDIDDFDGTSDDVSLIIDTAADIEYLLDLNLTVSIGYIQDNDFYGGNYDNTVIEFTMGTPSGTSNIKEINVTAEKDSETVTMLRAYSCNIGENSYQRRDF